MADENTKSDIPAKVDEVSDFDLPNEIIAACTALETSKTIIYTIR